MDLDQGGQPYQSTKVYLGPSLGWVMAQIRPETNITAAGTTTLTPGAGLVLVNVAGLVTVNLPDVTKWVNEFAYSPVTAFERAIWIKDLGGNAAAFNITVQPFGAQSIDNLAQAFTIVQNRQLLRLYPRVSSIVGWIAG